jgi:hypothetical protein
MIHGSPGRALWCWSWGPKWPFCNPNVTIANVFNSSDDRNEFVLNLDVARKLCSFVRIRTELQLHQDQASLQWHPGSQILSPGPPEVWHDLVYLTRAYQKWCVMATRLYKSLYLKVLWHSKADSKANSSTLDDSILKADQLLPKTTKEPVRLKCWLFVFIFMCCFLLVPYHFITQVISPDTNTCRD